MVGELDDPRRHEPTGELAERRMLEEWLEYHRITLVLKADGLSDEERKRRPIPSSLLSLHGLVRHMAEVERGWFEGVLESSDPDFPGIWVDPGTEDGELVPLDDAVWDEDLDIWQAQCETSRQIAAGRELDETGQGRDQRISLRWIYVHMIEEYARHNGHADLIRELIDGSVGV
jgi:uncharacterized damage-inducible protein DinB